MRRWRGAGLHVGRAVGQAPLAPRTGGRGELEGGDQIHALPWCRLRSSQHSDTERSWRCRALTTLAASCAWRFDIAATPCRCAVGRVGHDDDARAGQPPGQQHRACGRDQPSRPRGSCCAHPSLPGLKSPTIQSARTLGKPTLLPPIVTSGYVASARPPGLAVDGSRVIPGGQAASAGQAEPAPPTRWSGHGTMMPACAMAGELSRFWAICVGPL